MGDIISKLHDKYDDYLDYCERRKVSPVGFGADFLGHWMILRQKDECVQTSFQPPNKETK